MNARLRLAAGAMLIAMLGCETVAPAVRSLLMAFGQDLLAATAVNHSPRYAMEVERLLVTLAHRATGLPFEGRLAQAGYQPPPPDYARQDTSAGPYAGQPAYDQSSYGDHAGADAYGAEPYGANPSGYGQAAYEDPYAAAPYGQAGYQDPYAVPSAGAVTRSVDAQDPVSLGVALLARRAGSTDLEVIADGDTLRDGRGDPGQGDLLRVHFQTNCTCWVYVIGVDATGYVARIFPDPDSALTNPVTPGANHLMPGGDQWWALDDQRGIEQIYFIASREQRPDIEAAIDRLASQPRRLSAADVQPVMEPAVVPGTRGLVKVEAPAPVTLPLGGAAQARVSPTIFTNTDSATDVVVTRWFHHE